MRVKRGREWKDEGPRPTDILTLLPPDGLEEWRGERRREQHRRYNASPSYQEKTAARMRRLRERRKQEPSSVLRAA